MHMQALRVREYISNPLASSALEEDEWSGPRPANFTPTQDRVPILQEAGCPRERSVWARKIMPPLRFDPRTVQPLSSRYRADVIPTAAFVGRAYITSGNFWCNLDGIYCRMNF
jgi:hypothetical protein